MKHSPKLKHQLKKAKAAKTNKPQAVIVTACFLYITGVKKRANYS
jgi:hypothetical protein